MTVITAKQVGELREMTGAPLMQCKATLIETGGDFEGAIHLLRLRLRRINTPQTADLPISSAGYIAVYAHSGNQIVSLVELACDTDFVARNDDFRNAAQELAMQVAATAPVALLPDDGTIPSQCLLTQTSIRHPEITVGAILDDLRLRIGENVYIRRFARWQVREMLPGNL